MKREQLEPQDLDEVELYRKSIPEVPYNTLEQDIQLGMAVDLGKKAKKKLLEEGLAEGLRSELENSVKAGEEAISGLVIPCLPLVVSEAAHAKRRTNTSIDFIDLIQEGNRGLTEAARRYDYTRGAKFITHATWWVRKRINNALEDQERTIRFPKYLVRRLAKMHAISDKFKREKGREPDAEELRKMLNISRLSFKALIRADHQITFSLDEPANQDSESGGPISDFIVDESQMSIENAVDIRLLRQDLNKALRVLPMTEERVLRLASGFGEDEEKDSEPFETKKIAQKLGISRQRVNQITSGQTVRLKRFKKGAIKINH